MTMHYNDLVGGFRLSPRTALLELLGEVDFSVNGFGMDLEEELTLVLENEFFWGGGGRAGALREPTDSNRWMAWYCAL